MKKPFVRCAPVIARRPCDEAIPPLPCLNVIVSEARPGADEAISLRVSREQEGLLRKASQ